MPRPQDGKQAPPPPPQSKDNDKRPPMPPKDGKGPHDDKIMMIRNLASLATK